MRVVANWKTTLSASITSSQTTIPVSSIQTSDDTKVTITVALIDSFGYMVIEPGSSRIELIKFTGITSNGDGTGTLTGVTRGLAFSGGTETEKSGNAKAHQAGSTIMMSNVHYYYDKLVDTDQTETVAGIKIFSSLPQTTAGNPVADNDLARKAYIDQTATGTTIIAAIVVPGIAGATIADGDLLYLNTSDGKWWLTDADGASWSENVLLGIAQGAGTANAAITNGVLLLGLDDAQSGMTAGNVMYLSGTAGDISSTPGTKEVTVGVARSATVLYFCPRFNQQLTEDQQDALAGSSGTPSASNLYVTANDVSAAGGSGKIIRASLTLIAPGILIPVEQLQRSDNSQGDILYRAADKWTRLVAGVNKQVLQTQGAAANPQWVKVGCILSRNIIGAAVSMTTNSSYYTVPFSVGTISTTEYQGMLMPYAGTIRNLYVRTGATNGGPITAVTVRKNASNTALTITSLPSANTTYSDTVNSFTVVAGDLITILITTGNGAGSDEPASIVMELDL